MPTADLFVNATEALQRGQGADAATLLVRAIRQPGASRDESLQLRCSLAEAWLLQDDLRQATDALYSGTQLLPNWKKLFT